MTTGNLASRLAASIQKHKVPGASAAVFRAGQWEVAAAGVTNVTTGVEVTPETVMHVGSITKVLNTTLMMQLVDEGRVDLQAPLKRYLPDFQVANRDATDRITVEMLLNHTSGIDGASRARFCWRRHHLNSLDLRVGKILRFGRTWTNVAIDVYNLFNSNTGTVYNQTYNPVTNGATWLAPTQVLNARFARSM